MMTTTNGARKRECVSINPGAVDALANLWLTRLTQEKHGRKPNDEIRDSAREAFFDYIGTFDTGVSGERAVSDEQQVLTSGFGLGLVIAAAIIADPYGNPAEAISNAVQRETAMIKHARGAV